MDENGQDVVHGRSTITFIDFFIVYFGADEDKLTDDESGKVDYSSSVVVEKEQLGLVESLTSFDKSLVF